MDPVEPITGESAESGGTNSSSEQADRVGDLKLFEPKTICPLIAMRDREER
jgi:hypothetical protein